MTIIDRSTRRLLLAGAATLSTGCVSEQSSTPTGVDAVQPVGMSMSPTSLAASGQRFSDLSHATGSRNDRRAVLWSPQQVMAMTAEGRRNRAVWFKGATLATNPERFCAGVIALIAHYLPAHSVRGPMKDHGSRLHEAGRLVRNVSPDCAPYRSMSILSSAAAVIATARLTVRAPEASSGDTMTTAEAEAWADANQAAIEADAIASQEEYMRSLEEYYESGGPSMDEPMAFWLGRALQSEGYRQAMLAGCIAEVRGGWSWVRVAVAAGASGGPLAMFANGVLAAGGLCAAGAAAGALIKHLAT